MTAKHDREQERFVPDMNTSMSGHFEMLPRGPFEAGAFTTIAFDITVGSGGLKVGSRVKIATPNMGWGQPLCCCPVTWNEVVEGTERVHNPWKPINTVCRVESSGNTVIRLTADEAVAITMDDSRGLSDKDLVEIYGHPWRWWITALVEKDGLCAGDRILITYGDTESAADGARVQPWPEKNMLFAAFVDPKGDGCYRQLQGSPVPVDVVPGPCEKTVSILPSIASVGESVRLRSCVLDRNLCVPHKPFGEEIKIGRHSSVDVSQARDDGGGGFVEVLCRQPGTVCLDVSGPDDVRTNPMVVSDSPEKLFWGDLHSQSMFHMWVPALSHGGSCLRPAEVHAYARDCSMLDFAAVTDAFSVFPYNPGWEEIQQAAVECYEPGRYVSFKGWESGMGKQGDRCVVYRTAEMEDHFPCEYTGELPHLPLDEDAPTPAHALIRFYRERNMRVLTIPHSFMKYLDWTVTDPEFDRLMEIYSCWGCYESRSENFLNTKRQPRNQSARHAWRSGLLLGITAAGDSHVGRPGRSMPFADRNWCHCHKAGLCAVYARELTREAIWDALYARSCYGTTGVRIVLDFRLNDRRMGSVIECPSDSDGLMNRNIRVKAVGCDLIRYVDVIKNNEIAHRCVPESDSVCFDFSDWLKEPASTRDWYYVRVVQADGNAAWSSPIWIGPENCTDVPHSVPE